MALPDAWGLGGLWDAGRVLTRLSMIPGDLDARAESILRGAPGKITAVFLDSLTEEDQIACARYGARMATIALRTGSVATLRRALLADAIARLLFEVDGRDTMIDRAVHFHVAKELGVAPVDVFNAVADRMPDGPSADRLREFGARDDVALHNFQWQQVMTPDGPDFVPTGWEGRIWLESMTDCPDARASAASAVEFEQFGRHVAQRLGCIVSYRDIGLPVEPTCVVITNAPWSEGSARIPFRVDVWTGFPDYPCDLFSIVVTLLDPQRRTDIASVEVQGWTTAGIMAEALTLPPPAMIKMASANMDILEHVTAARGDRSTAVRICTFPGQQLIRAVGYRNPSPRPATVADLDRLKALTGETLASLAAAVGAQACLSDGL